MTQYQLIKEWCEIHGKIIPAKMSGTVFMGTMFGSETSKRCRELRAKGVLSSSPEGKFEVYWLKDTQSDLKPLESSPNASGGVSASEVVESVERRAFSRITGEDIWGRSFAELDVKRQQSEDRELNKRLDWESAKLQIESKRQEDFKSNLK